MFSFTNNRPADKRIKLYLVIVGNVTKYRIGKTVAYLFYDIYGWSKFVLTRSVSFHDLNVRKLKCLKRRKPMVKHHSTLVHFFCINMDTF